MIRKAVLALITVVSSVPAFAQSREIPAPKQAETVVIHSATVHPISGPAIENGYVVFADGLIESVGAGAAPETPGARRFDASGMHVFPGLVAMNTTLGLTEVGAVDVTQDHTEYGRVTPEVRAAVAVNPDSDLLTVTRANGILTALVMPRGGLVSGRGSVLRLDGWTWEDLAIDDACGLVVNWPRTEPVTAWWMQQSADEQRKQIREDLERVDDLFDEAEAYVAAKADDPALATDLRFEAMGPALRGEKPVYVRASSAGQIEASVAWAVRRGLRIVIVGGNEADRVIPLLTKHDVPVIVGGLHRMPPARHAAYDQPFTLPLRLHEAGVRFAIASGAGAAHERNLNHNVATAAAYGLPKEVAHASVTLAAATIIEQGDRLGSLDAGKSATLIVTTGDPLEITTDTVMAFIDGRRVDLGNRHKALYEKYREKYRQLGILE